MSDIDRLTAELELANACEVLEAARGAMHADRSDENIAAYRAACEEVFGLRRAFRETYQAQPGPGDAAPAVDTIQTKAGVKLA